MMQQLDALQQPTQTLALTVDDRVILVPQHDIISLEVTGTQMTVQTTTTTYAVHGQLKQALAKLSSSEFSQVSKNTVINLNHLTSLEPAFSGNMTARLTNNVKVVISRKYLPALKQQLGM